MIVVLKFQYTIMTHCSVIMTYYVVFMLISYLVVSVVSDAKYHNCNPIYISSLELQRLQNTQCNVFRQCDVSRGQSLDILFDDVINSHKCRSYIYDTFFMSEDSEYLQQITIPNIEKITMSEIWECQVASLFGKSNIYIEINIKGVTPPQLIFVNRVALIVEKNFETKHEVQYNYQNGDTVDIACINLDSRYTGHMTYKTADGYQNRRSFFFEEYTTMWEVGFQKKLQSEDNGMRIYCTSKCLDSETNVTVRFSESSSSTNRYTNVNINGHKVNAVSHRSLQPYTYYINYAYFKNDELINIVCDASEHAYVYLSLSSCENCKLREPPKYFSENMISLTIKARQLSKIVFIVKQNNAILETVIIFFTQIQSYVPNNVKHTKVSPPLDRFVTLTMTSVTPVTTPLTSPVTPTPALIPPVTTPLPTPSTTTTVAQSTTTLQTTLSTLTANSLDSDRENGENDNSVIFMIVGIVVIIILIGVFIGIYKMKIRDCRKKKNNENDENVTNEDGIPSYPPQWNSEYAVSKDMFQNQTIYAEPCIPDSDHEDHCQYAHLDFKGPTSTGIYSEVLPKSVRKKTIYGNIGNISDEPNYARIRTESDHVKPTYSTVCVTK